MSLRDKREERQAHPGWAIRFSDGSWLGGAHGWFTSDEAFYADIYDTAEEAQKTLDWLRKDSHSGIDIDGLGAEIILAWEPVCEHLRLEISCLRKATNVDVYDLGNIVDDIEYKLKDIRDMLKDPK